VSLTLCSRRALSAAFSCHSESARVPFHQSMEHWHANSTAQVQVNDTRPPLSTRVLGTISGNVQTYALGSKGGTENQHFSDLADQGAVLAKSVPLYSTPNFTLGSNDNRAERLQHLKLRRHLKESKPRQRLDPSRPYLQDTKYIAYRARQRYDRGVDGKPVWDDRIEDSFQNGQQHAE